MALIDVLIPVRNGMPYLAASLESLQHQTFQNWRALVMDHGSIDGTAELIQKFAASDPRIELHSRPEADGLSALLNAGLDLVTAPYMMRHDADDVCHPERMAKSLAYLEAHGHIAVVGTQARVVSASGEHIGMFRRPCSPLALAINALFITPIAHPTAMFRMSMVKELGVRYGVDFISPPTETRHPGVKGLAEDYFLFGQLAIQGLCANLPEALLDYRWHGDNESSRKFLAQTTMAIELSRFMALRSCGRHGLPCFDPVSMATHGGVLIVLDPAHETSRAFQALKSLAEVCSQTGYAEVQRELSYRHMLSTRSTFTMIARALKHVGRFGFDRQELNPVLSWVTRGYKGGQPLQMDASGAISR